MTTITLPRATVEQALEALETLVPTKGPSIYNSARDDLRAALAQQAEPVQEPFGYLWPTGRHPEFRFTQQKRDGVDGMPLYTAPPQRLPLTEDEIYHATGHCGVSERTAINIARAVEAEHGIKE